MSLPKPARPTEPGLNAPNQTLQRHLPSPVISNHLNDANKNVSKTDTELKEEKEAVQSVDAFPAVFDEKYNTAQINWNELHYLSAHKGRTVYVHELIQKHYGEQLANYNANNTSNALPKIADLPEEILKFVHHILTETSIVLEAHETLHTHNNWETQVDDYDGISVFYRAEDHENGIHSIKVQYTSKCHPVDLIAVINEFDLMKEIVTICPLQTQYLKQFTDVDKVIYSKINLWWPLKNRDAVAHVRAHNLLEEHDEILIWGKSIEKLDGVEIPTVEKGTLRMDVRMAEGAIKPRLLEDGKIGTEVVACFNVDFKTFLPKKLLNWVTRTFAYYVCKMIRSTTEDLKGTKYEQRIAANKVYVEFQQNFEDWKQKKLAGKGLLAN